MARSRFEYAIYLSSPPEKVWSALLDPEATREYWQHENRSEWKVGSRWEHRGLDGEDSVDLAGTVVEFDPPRRLVLTWAFPENEGSPKDHSKVTLTIEPHQGSTRVTVIHEDLEPDSEMVEGITDGWPKVLSSLKSYLETGRALPKLW
jgi:uncharacterized protein YndB with AHSA1/START domain